MRRLIPVVLCSIALSATAGIMGPVPTDVIDLDKPGALETLQRDNPGRYEAIMKLVDEAQAVPNSDKGIHNLASDNIHFQSGMKLSYPGQSRVIFTVDDTSYVMTMRHTKDPGHLVPAR
jgi:hypothetical protein